VRFAAFLPHEILHFIRLGNSDGSPHYRELLLGVILLAICGRIGVRGGNVFPGHVMPLGAHSDERDSKTWRTVATGFPAIMGTFPPNVMPEEIMTEGPDRIRAVIVARRIRCDPIRIPQRTNRHSRS